MTKDQIKDWLQDTFAWVQDLLSSGTFWSSIGSIAGVAAAIAAFMTISASNTVRKEEIESRRPYFVIKDPRYSIKDGGNGLLLNINIINEGGRPASDVSYKMKVMPIHDVDKSEAPENALAIEANHDFEHSTDLAPNIVFPWWLDYPQRTDIAPLYYKLTISYRDGLIDRSYTQAYYMKWDGVENGSTKPNLTYASKQQSEAIDFYLASKGDVDKDASKAEDK